MIGVEVDYKTIFQFLSSTASIKIFVHSLNFQVNNT